MFSSLLLLIYLLYQYCNTIKCRIMLLFLLVKCFLTFSVIYEYTRWVMVKELQIVP